MSDATLLSNRAGDAERRLKRARRGWTLQGAYAAAQDAAAGRFVAVDMVRAQDGRFNCLITGQQAPFPYVGAAGDTPDAAFELALDAFARTWGRSVNEQLRPLAVGAGFVADRLATIRNGLGGAKEGTPADSQPWADAHTALEQLRELAPALDNLLTTDPDPTAALVERCARGLYERERNAYAGALGEHHYPPTTWDTMREASRETYRIDARIVLFGREATDGE